MNLLPSWVTFLCQHNIEAIHWSSVADGRASDSEIMTWVLENGYIVFTHDLDFTTLLALTGVSGPSVIQLRSQDVLPDAVGQQVVSVLNNQAPSIQSGATVTVDLVLSRVRLLPIRRL